MRLCICVFNLRPSSPQLQLQNLVGAGFSARGLGAGSGSGLPAEEPVGKMADTAGCLRGGDIGLERDTGLLNRGCGWPVAARGGTQPHKAAGPRVLTIYVAPARSGQGPVSGFTPPAPQLDWCARST